MHLPDELEDDSKFTSSGMDMDYFNVILEEAKRLQAKLDNLNVYIRTNKFKELTSENQFLLEQQAAAMHSYLTILRRRININK